MKHITVPNKKFKITPKKSIIVKNTVIVKPVAIVTAFLLPEPHVPLFLLLPLLALSTIKK